MSTNRHQAIYIAGHRGMVGSAIVRRLQALGYTNLITAIHAELDLTNQAAVQAFFAQEKPDQVYLAAAKVGGIHANNTYPAEFIYQNTDASVTFSQSAAIVAASQAFLCPVYSGGPVDLPGIAPAPEAAKATLVRRVYFDLTGLPPSPEDLKTFLDDAAPDAYERLVDRLLASPQFGERWARHWLDTVRFGESGGYEFDGDRPHASLRLSKRGCRPRFIEASCLQPQQRCDGLEVVLDPMVDLRKQKAACVEKTFPFRSGSIALEGEAERVRQGLEEMDVVFAVLAVRGVVDLKNTEGRTGIAADHDVDLTSDAVVPGRLHAHLYA
jgi:hypothetical protein